MFQQNCTLSSSCQDSNDLTDIKLLKIISNKVERYINFQQGFAIRDENGRKCNVNVFQTKSLYITGTKKGYISYKYYANTIPVSYQYRNSIVLLSNKREKVNIRQISYQQNIMHMFIHTRALIFL